MDINAERDGTLLTAKPVGRLDGTTSRKFEDDLKLSIGDDRCNVLLDLSEIQYISSAGLRAILLITKSVTSKGDKLALCSLTNPVKEVFEISGFDRIIPIYDTFEEARNSLR